jgi:hypothetical protein
MIPRSGGGTLPQDPAQAMVYLNELAQQVQINLDEMYLSFFSVTYAEPEKPRNFMIRLADGASWNPGYGLGLYQYYGGTWHPLWAEQWG